eukprot:9496480-Pyramimonas_sp.AAC.1
MGTRRRPRHPWGAAICEAVATFHCCWGGQQSEHSPRIQSIAIPDGAAICEVVATFQGCWGCQKS